MTLKKAIAMVALPAMAMGLVSGTSIAADSDEVARVSAKDRGLVKAVRSGRTKSLLQLQKNSQKLRKSFERRLSIKLLSEKSLVPMTAKV